MINVAFYCFAGMSYFYKEIITKGNSIFNSHVIIQKSQHKNMFDNILPQSNILYLYEYFNKYYEDKNFSINIGDIEDNIFNILEIDKGFYKLLDKKKQEKLFNIIYHIYKKFLAKRNIKYVIFPDVETVDGGILMNLCYELNIEPVYYVHGRYFGVSFFSNKLKENLPRYYGKFNQEDLRLAEQFLLDFKNNSISPVNFKKTYSSNDRIEIKVNNLFFRICKSIVSYFKYEKHAQDSIFLKIKMNIVNLVLLFRKKKFILCQKRLFDIKENKEIDNIPEHFILFALQVSPESSINTLEQYYIEQERAIDLIRLNMPHGFYIVVKEHPAMMGIRENYWYKKMRKKAGIILITPEVDTQDLVDKADLVVTITGTIGLECYLKDKPVLMFGSTFFSHLVYRFDGYLNFKENLRNMIFNYKPDLENEKIVKLAKIYNISYNIFLQEPFYFPEVMEIGNIKNYLLALQDHIRRLKEFDERL